MPPPALPDAPRSRAALLFWLVLGGWWLFFAAVAYLAPLQGEDWSQVILARERGLGPSSLLRFVGQNRTLGDLAELLIGAVRPLHIILSPTVVVALFVGAFTLGLRRLPRPSDARDTLLLVLGASLIWIGAPRVGLALFYRPYLAHFVYGLTAVLWLLVLYERADRSPGGRWRGVGVFALGLVGGTGNLHVTVAALVTVLIWIRGHRRRGSIRGWMWAGAAGLAVGLGLLVSASPPDYISQFAHRKFSGNLGLLYLFVGEGGELIAFVTTVALLAVVKDRLVGGRTPVPPERALRNVAWCFFAALAMAGVGLAARRWGEPAMFAPTVVLAMGGLIVLETLVTDRWVRLGLLAWMIAVQVVVVAQALLYLVPAHAAFEQRIATLEAAPRGGTATIDPYPEVLPAFWFVGEDLGPATVRQEVAVRLFGLQDIQFSEPFARLEPPPHLPLRMTFVTEPAATPAELAAVVPPVIAADITVARRQFRSALRRLRRTHRVVDARLEAPELDFQGRNGRPVLLARLDGDDVIAPRAFAAGADRTNAYAFAPDERTWPDGYTVQVIGPGGVPIAVQEARRGLIFRPLVVDTFTLLLCNATECFAVQSMWTRM